MVRMVGQILLEWRHDCECASLNGGGEEIVSLILCTKTILWRLKDNIGQHFILKNIGKTTLCQCNFIYMITVREMAGQIRKGSPTIHRMYAEL